MLRARRDPDDLLNNIWIVTDEPEFEAPKGGLILPPEYIERRLRTETKHIFKAALPWTVDTEEEAIAAALGCKTEIEERAAAEAAEIEARPVDVVKDGQPDAARDAHKAKEEAFDEGAASAALDAAVIEGAKVLRAQLDAKAEVFLAHEPQDATVNRVIASLLVGEAGQAARRQGLNRAALVAKLQEKMPPKSEIITL